MIRADPTGMTYTAVFNLCTLYDLQVIQTRSVMHRGSRRVLLLPCLASLLYLPQASLTDVCDVSTTAPSLTCLASLTPCLQAPLASSHPSSLSPRLSPRPPMLASSRHALMTVCKGCVSFYTHAYITDIHITYIHQSMSWRQGYKTDLMFKIFVSNAQVVSVCVGESRGRRVLIRSG